MVMPKIVPAVTLPTVCTMCTTGPNSSGAGDLDAGDVAAEGLAAAGDRPAFFFFAFDWGGEGRRGLLSGLGLRLAVLEDTVDPIPYK